MILGNSDYCRRVQESITAAIEGMPETTRFGLITFDHRIGIWNLENVEDEGNNLLTSVHHIPISSNGNSKVFIENILSIDQFLVPVSELYCYLVY